MKKLCFIILFITELQISAQRVPLFGISRYYDEQVYSFVFNNDVLVNINAPAINKFDPQKKTLISLYALPNGSSTGQTIGLALRSGDDWHYNIQHIGAQTRFLRNNFDEYNFVTVYLENSYKSWPAWSTKHNNKYELSAQIVDSIRTIFKNYNADFILTGHSGGGRFIFNFMDHYESIPGYINRIAFLDSDYGYNNFYGDKIIKWLDNSEDNYLCVLAYNDSVALYNGKPFVSDTGGTWYKSRMMKNYFDNFYEFKDEEDFSFIRYTALNGRVKIILKKNPNREIYHTVLVERNGYIHSMLTGLPLEESNYKYYGERVYSDLIQEHNPSIKALLFPQRDTSALGGLEFMNSIKDLPTEEREDKIYQALISGNIPNFMRHPIQLKAEFKDANGKQHNVFYQTLPDYLCVGSDSDYCRVPMNPKTAQRIADKFGMTLPTRKLVDNIYVNCTQKLKPITYPWSEGLSETVERFIEHSASINNYLKENKAVLGELVGGIKKDVVISNLLEDTTRVNHVTIYGWHKPEDGLPIQPLSNIHIEKYVDYSHGIRLINSEILLDGKVVEIKDILSDPVLYKVLSDENCPMPRSSYLGAKE